MDLTDRFFKVYDLLKKQGKIGSHVELGQVIGTNKAGVSDIKYGRKKLTIDHIKNMKISYPRVNLEWIILNEGEVFEEKEKNIHSGLLVKTQQKLIEKLEEEIQELKKAQEPQTGYPNAAEPDP